MTLEDIYYIGQTIAVVAILVSLVAVWFEMRQGHLLARADLSNQFRLANQSLTMRMVDDPELGRAFRTLVLEGGRIDDPDTFTRMIGWFGAYSNLYFDAVDASKKGLMDEWLFLEIENAWAQYLAVPAVWSWQQRILSLRPPSDLIEEIKNKQIELRERALAHQAEMRSRQCEQEGKPAE